MSEHNNPEQSGEDTIIIEDVNQFVALTAAWHNKKVQTLEHMMEIPSGTEATFNKGEPMILEGDLLKGFVLGLQMALMELGTLPFKAELDQRDDGTELDLDAPVMH